MLVTWRDKCRCGKPLSFSCEDIETHTPAEGSDFWCSDPDPKRGPHDWGVVVYKEVGRPLLRGVSS